MRRTQMVIVALCCCSALSAQERAFHAQTAFAVDLRSGPAQQYSGFTLPLFDRTQGKLLQVTITGTVAIEGTFTGFSVVQSPITFSSEVGVTMPGYGLVTRPPLLAGATEYGGYALNRPFRQEKSYNIVLNSVEDLAMFSSPGPKSTVAHLSSFEYYIGGGDPPSELRGTASCDLDVAYTYAAVPEPASAAVLGGAVLLFRRRRKAA